MKNEENIEMRQGSTLLGKIKNMGPAAIICATVIGPGTVTTCSLAGVNFKYGLAWAVLFAAISTIVLQLMASRLGIITGKGLSENIRVIYNESWLKVLFVIIVVFAIGVGNSAYQGGNMAGAVMGVSAVFGLSRIVLTTTISAIVFLLLWSGTYNLVEKIMTVLVALMVFLFVATAAVLRPNPGELLSGLFIPSIPDGSLLVAMGVIGTTIVPHCFFMHSAMTATKWRGIDTRQALEDNRFDVMFNIIIAGVISLAIIITGASLYSKGVNVKSGLDLAKQLEPLVGTWAKYFFGLGLFAAGITSATAAPLSAAYAITGILGWSTELKDKKFRIIWIIVLATGYIVSSTGINPIQIIVLAQAFNGILLPLSAIILLIAMNNRKYLGDYVNTRAQNVIGAMIILITIILGARTLYMVVSRFL